MAVRRIQQFRYYGENQDANYPPNLSYTDLRTGRVFDNFVPFVQLGIQAVPGTKFYLNGGDTPITIGTTGIYEIDYEDIVKIYALSFDATDLSNIVKEGTNMVDNRTYGIIVDVVYEGAGT